MTATRYANMRSHMGNAGRDNTYFARELDGAIKRRDLDRIRMCVPTVHHLSLYDKAQILDVVRTENRDLYGRAAGKFIRDYVNEREPDLAEIDKVVDYIDPLVFALDPLLEMIDPRRHRAT